MTWRVTVLGCGTSTGVPMVGCDCPVCRSEDARNQRLRTSIALRDGQHTILFDTSTDLRQQCLVFGVERVDAVIYTHAHADHIFGLDDLRPFNFRQGHNIPCYGSAATLGAIRRTFAYAFETNVREGGGRPGLRLEPVQPEQNFSVCGLSFQPVPVMHGSLEVYAYRCGPFAYVTDTNHLPAAAFDALRGVRYLILDALRYRPHSTHFSLDEAIEVARQLGAERTWFTHLAHDIDYTAPAVELPSTMELAYDGLEFDIT